MTNCPLLYHVFQFEMYEADYALLPLSVVGMGIGPPGESSSLAVKTSTPVSVTSKVCSPEILA